MARDKDWIQISDFLKNNNQAGSDTLLVGAESGYFDIGFEIPWIRQPSHVKIKQSCLHRIRMQCKFTGDSGLRPADLAANPKIRQKLEIAFNSDPVKIDWVIGSVDELFILSDNRFKKWWNRLFPNTNKPTTSVRNIDPLISLPKGTTWNELKILLCDDGARLKISPSSRAIHSNFRAVHLNFIQLGFKEGRKKNTDASNKSWKTLRDFFSKESTRRLPARGHHLNEAERLEKQIQVINKKLSKKLGVTERAIVFDKKSRTYTPVFELANDYINGDDQRLSTNNDDPN